MAAHPGRVVLDLAYRLPNIQKEGSETVSCWLPSYIVETFRRYAEELGIKKSSLYQAMILCSLPTEEDIRQKIEQDGRSDKPSRKGRSPEADVVPAVLDLIDSEFIQSLLSNLAKCKERWGSQETEGVSMGNKPETTVIDKEVCIHHWIIETGRNGQAPGECKKCGAIRTFSNSIPGHRVY